MAGNEFVCPDCKQSVDTVVRRHKTLGVFVPVWAAGPCRDPRCASHEADQGTGRSGAEPVLTAPAAASQPLLPAEPGPQEELRAGTERDR